MEKFIILCRYESWTEEGKNWCKWFVRDPKPRTLEESKQRIESLKASSAGTSRITKLKYEFKPISVKEYKKIKTSFWILTEW